MTPYQQYIHKLYIKLCVISETEREKMRIECNSPIRELDLDITARWRLQEATYMQELHRETEEKRKEAMHQAFRKYDRMCHLQALRQQ
jgi:hypothetical protein